MLVAKSTEQELYNDAGEERVQKARLYVKTGRTQLEKINYNDEKNFEITGKVTGQEVYRTHIYIEDGEIEDITCECLDYQNRYAACKHIVATMMEFANNSKYEEMIKHQNSIDVNKTLRSDSKYRSFKQIVNEFYTEEMHEIEQSNNAEEEIEKIKIEPKLIYDKYTNTLRVEFKIGNQRMYKLKDLKEFYNRMLTGEKYKYGNKLEFFHKKENFADDAQELLNFILKQSEIIKFVNSDANSNYRYYGKAMNESYILLNNSGLDEFFNILKSKQVIFQKEYTDEEIEFIDSNPELHFVIQKSGKNEYKITISPKVDLLREIEILQGRKSKYLLLENKLYHCSKEYDETVLKLIEMLKNNFLTELVFGKEQLPELFSVVLPRMKNGIVFEGIDENQIEKYRPKKLGVKMFLDFDENEHIIADARFCYGEEEFNPLQPKIEIKYPRDVVAENKVINMLRKTGFMLDTKNTRFILPYDDDIYRFLTEDINYYMKNFEVMVTENFKAKQIKTPKIGGLGIKVENDLLSIDLSKLDIDTKELEDIMAKYSLRKKFYRLKDGSFIDLQENKEIEFLDKLATGMGIDYKELQDGEIQLPVNRTLYLNQLLKGIQGTEILKNQEYKDIINNLNKEQLEETTEIPSNLNANLRYYQKTGYKWLKTLDKYRFGGILADDMGLGKTVQMLSVIVDYAQNEGKRASLVVSPSSLTLNWLNEVEKFAPDLQSCVIRGSAVERKNQIENIGNYDLVITSYDLLKRDIDLYKEKNYKFRYIIADEAQYLKNSTTKNAKAIKQIKADTRYALTGTPIENSLSELWSIFDFIMPGYLFTYKKFKNIYEMPIVKKNDENAMQKLKMLIEPFVLRRNKKEVLTELPDKTVTVLNNEMNEEQQKIYLNYLAQAKQDIQEQINLNGYEHSHMQILAALTRLRQICCHPSLFISDYKDGSSKLDQCIEIIEDAINGGHKILLFSGYTSMFQIIEKELKERNITYVKLTGATKVDERIKLVDEFNANSEIKVFLISLKAGGTGLNLTGADMVIHYDPWWNISTENQATDRAYRIGQKNNVQVYKLITKNSIEEKIYELQERKATLANNMLDTKAKFINQLSKDEIMNLFE